MMHIRKSGTEPTEQPLHHLAPPAEALAMVSRRTYTVDLSPRIRGPRHPGRRRGRFQVPPFPADRAQTVPRGPRSSDLRTPRRVELLRPSSARHTPGVSTPSPAPTYRVSAVLRGSREHGSTRVVAISEDVQATHRCGDAVDP